MALLEATAVVDFVVVVVDFVIVFGDVVVDFVVVAKLSLSPSSAGLR